MSKLQIISDKNKKSLSIKNLLLNKIKSNQFKKENLIIVIGGDGFMLQTLKKNRNSKKSFYGINSGNYGFLMNKFSKKTIAKDRTGKTTDLKLVAEINLEYKEENSASNDQGAKVVSFSEDFKIKKNQNNSEQRDYEKSIKKNLSQKLTDKKL